MINVYCAGPKRIVARFVATHGHEGKWQYTGADECCPMLNKLEYIRFCNNRCKGGLVYQ